MRRKILTIITTLFLTTMCCLLFTSPTFAASTSSDHDSPSTLTSPDGSRTCTGYGWPNYGPSDDPTLLIVAGLVTCNGTVRDISITPSLYFCDQYHYSCLDWVQVAKVERRLNTCTSDSTPVGELDHNYCGDSMRVNGYGLWLIRADWCVRWWSGSQDCSIATKEQWALSTGPVLNTLVHGFMNSGPSSMKLWFVPAVWTTGYVILHYTIPGQVQQNVYMSYNSSPKRWEYTINGLSSGQKLTYSLTYERNGRQYETDWYPISFS
jgi:hypothetical protein